MTSETTAPQQLPTGIEVGEFCQDCRKPLTECTCETQQGQGLLPCHPLEGSPGWVRTPPIATMRDKSQERPRHNPLCQSCHSAMHCTETPDKCRHSPQQGRECEHGLDRRLPCGDCQKEYEYQQQGKIAPCPVHELLLKRNCPYHASLAAECPLRRQPDLDKLASELESMAATLHEPPCECAMCAQVRGIATYIRNWKGGGE